MIRHLSLFFILCSSMITANEALLELENYSGSGCPTDTVSAVSSPDGKTLSIIFDQFIAEVPNLNPSDNHKFRVNYRGKKIDQNTIYINHKLCDLIFSSLLKPGYKVESLEVSVQTRGATILDENVFARYSGRLINFQGFNGVKQRKASLVKHMNWGNEQDFTEDDWFLDTTKIIPINSSCASNNQPKAFFSFRNHLMVENRHEDDVGTGLISLDTADIQGFLKFKLNLSRCGGVQSRTNNRPRPGVGNTSRPSQREAARERARRRNRRSGSF